LSNTFIAEGNSIPYTPVADVQAGTLLQVGTLHGLASNAIEAGGAGGVHIVGVVELPTDATLFGSSVAAGNLVGIDVAGQQAVPSGAGDFDLPASEPKPAQQDWVRVSMRNYV
jgi:predicted RecA/RadA family phage recombinase